MSSTHEQGDAGWGSEQQRKAGKPRVSTFASPAVQSLLLLLLLVAATIAVYYPLGDHPFIDFDDSKYVTENGHIHAGLEWSTVQWAFTTFHASNWHPLTWLSHALDWQMFGPDPAGHHEINLVLHALNVALLFWVLVRATGRVGRSAVVAGLFALHPINVESVAWLAERKNLLSTLFLLLTMAAYRHYASRYLWRAGRYAAVFVLFALGLMAKPQIIVLPFLLLLWDYWPLERLLPPPLEKKAVPQYPPRTVKQLLLEKVPLLVLCAASAVVTLKAQIYGGAVQSLIRFPFWLRVENAVIAYARYLAKTVWPAPLAPLYPFSRTAPPLSQFVMALAVLAESPRRCITRASGATSPWAGCGFSARWFP